MQDGREWTLEFFVDERGESPVVEFLDSLDDRTRARFRWSMEQLRVRNVQAREPLVRHLGGDLWELREESRTNIYRIVYFFFVERRSFSFMDSRRRPRGRREENLRPPGGDITRSASANAAEDR